MSTITFIDIFDPRGRANRKGFGVAAVLLLAAQAVAYALIAALDVPLEAGPTYVIHCSFLWVALVATVKRLHDLGHGSMRIVWALRLLIIWSFVVAVSALMTFPDATFEIMSPAYLGVAAITTLPLLIALIGLHCKTGEPQANVYGDVPGASGFSFPHDRQANLLASRLSPSRIGS